MKLVAACQERKMCAAGYMTSVFVRPGGTKT